MFEINYEAINKKWDEISKLEIELVKEGFSVDSIENSKYNIYCKNKPCNNGFQIKKFLKDYYNAMKKAQYIKRFDNIF